MTIDQSWTQPEINLGDVVAGDMPGDSIQIGETHLKRADAVYKRVREAFVKAQAAGQEKYVISVYGGSGVGKSEIGSLIAHYFKLEGIGAYVMSGDNYPRRIPAENDRERLNSYRQAGLAAFAGSADFTEERQSDIKALWGSLEDMNPDRAAEIPGLNHYQQAGRTALRDYLSSDREINFDQVNAIIRQFREKTGNTHGCIALKRMGRTPEDLSYEAVDFSNIRVLVIEWTHGNNRRLQGIDYPVFLYSTPEETLNHRLSRARDNGADSAFFNTVLSLEQTTLNSQIDRATLIVSKNADELDPAELKKELGV